MTALAVEVGESTLHYSTIFTLYQVWFESSTVGMELSCFDFDIVYRPGKENIAPDTFSRSYCSSTGMSHRPLLDLHESLCHPGVTRIYHFVKSKNLPYSVEDVRRMTSSCKIYAECKPRFYRPENSHLIVMDRHFVLFIMLFLIINSTYFIVRGAPGPRGVNVP